MWGIALILVSLLSVLSKVLRPPVGFTVYIFFYWFVSFILCFWSDDVLKYIPMSVAAGTLVFLIGEAVYPVPYTRMDRSKGVLFCFCFEFAFSCLQQTRNALYLLIQNKFLDSAKRSKTDRSDERFHFYASGLDITASFVTASLVSIGCYFSPGGPMLHLSYVTMASLAARDWFMFLLLGTANLLSGYTAGRYVTMGLTASRCSTIEEVQHSSLLSPAQSSEEKKKHK